MSRPASWVKVVSNIWNSITKATPPKRYIGQDEFGNKFYEFEGHGRNSNVKRGYDHGHDHSKEPSVEWQSWIKGARRFPPSEQELALNRAKQQAQLIQDSETERRAPNISSEGKGAADVDRPRHFPKYDDKDIEITPGQEPKSKE